MEAKCPVCGTSILRSTRQQPDSMYFECPGCGPYALTHTAMATLPGMLKLGEERKARAKLSHAIFKMSGGGKWAQLSDELIRTVLQDRSLPLPSEQIDNLITWMGAVQGDPGARVDSGPSAVSAIGAVDFNGFAFIADEARKRGLIDCNVQRHPGLGQQGDQFLVTPMQLTVEGWNRLEELRRGRSSTRIAFMAMPFGRKELDELYRDHFQRAVADTGFTLKRLDEDQPAGLIDDRLRVEIRQCRFLISDLTHGNAGAYWEAGYAEGLGKPVIYTCEKAAFDDRAKGTHFDTNHHLTVVWEAASPGAAVSKLKATIRATLPDEASLTDKDLR